ncbi:MAG TPA: FAD-dependent oxidoreductase, partial [Stackebrandtia sp.]|uniref:NAD(P)/FAD-dependent oxidoreductase n=1 Tax=Stackebrandtia sp. TaxID=2023065 RepID=UPI002D5EAEE2
MEPRVLILGGGFAGLETAFTLRQRLRGKVRIGLVSGQRDFVFKPNTIYLPFGAAESKLRIGLERPLDRRDIDFHRAVVRDVDTTNRVVQTSDDQRLGYDFLVVATGAAMRPEEVPGLSDNAQMIWTPRQMRALGDRLAELRDAARAGEHRDVLFVVPPNNKCSGPLYEMVFMLETWLRRNRIRDRVTITWATYEDGYIQAFGPRLHQVVSEEFAARGIDGHTAMSVREVLPDQAIFHNGEKRRFDLLVAFPPYVAAVDYPGLPADRRGFLRTELTTRQVFGHPEIYAPGDAGDFPVKQAFLAFLQADAVADDIAAHV